MAETVVITGGAGFLGSHLSERLLADGCSVICLDNFCTGTPANVAHLIENPAFRLVRYDVTEYLHVGGPVDAVLHFASPASPVDYLELPIATLKVGSIGTMHALGLAREKGARFLLASTSEVYGDPLVHPQGEDYWGNVNPVGPRGVYDEAKRFSEALTVAYRKNHGVDTKIVRIFNTYGPRMRPNDGRAIPTFIRQALRGEPITVSGDGSQTRSVCYVTDLIEGILRLLRSPHPGPMNIGNPSELSVLELAETIRRMTGSQSPITFIAASPGRSDGAAAADRPRQGDPRVEAPGRAWRMAWRARSSGSASIGRYKRRTMTRAVRLSILMPVYNEAKTVQRAVKRVLDVSFPCPVEVVIVDDASTDGTSEIIDGLHDERLIKLRHPVNRGKGAAIRTAAAAATGDFMVPFDADLEYQPEEIPALLAPVLSGDADVVYGSRTFGSHSAYSFWYVMGNKAVTTLANVLFNAYIADLETCFKLMPLDLFGSLNVTSDGFGMEAEITGKLLARRIRPFEVPITYRARSREAGKKITWRDGAQAVWILARIRLTGRRAASPARRAERP